MNKYLLTALLGLALISVHAQKKHTLFNGKDISGWKVHGTEKWYVEKKASSFAKAGLINNTDILQPMANSRISS